MKIEKYISSDSNMWVRIKFTDKYRTEVIMPEEKFEEIYGKID